MDKVKNENFHALSAGEMMKIAVANCACDGTFTKNSMRQWNFTGIRPCHLSLLEGESECFKNGNNENQRINKIDRAFVLWHG